MRKFSNVTDYKFNIQKAIAFWCAKNLLENTIKEKPHLQYPQKIEYLGIKSIKMNLNEPKL